MSITDYFIISFSLLFTLSGFLINFVRGEKPKNIQLKSETKSLFWFRVLVPFGLIASLFIYFLKFGTYAENNFFAVTGSFFVILGFVIRWIAVLSLGSRFNVSLSIVKNHTLKTDGIYKFIRHPSYTGLLIYYFGLSVMMQNIFCNLVLIIFPLIAVLNRVRREEKMLKNYFGIEYEQYCSNSKKLFPFIF